MNFVSGWTASGQALAYGYNMISSGRIPTAFVGGAEAFNETVFRFNLSKNILATEKDTDGAVMGEGAGMLVLEDADSAAKRGANALAEIMGVGMAANIETAMANSLKDAEIKPEQVGLVITNANGIPSLDKTEKEAIKKVLGNPETYNVKPLIGETFGTAGILQVHVALSIMETQDKQIILVNNSDMNGNAVSVILRPTS